MKNSDFQKARELQQLTERTKDLYSLSRAAKSANTSVYFSVGRGTNYVDEQGTALQNAYEAAAKALEILESTALREADKAQSKIWNIMDEIRPDEFNPVRAESESESESES